MSATGRVRRRNRKGRAVELLPHLEQPMNRARVVGVVRMGRAGDLEHARRKRTGVLTVVFDARIGLAARLARAAGQKKFRIIGRQAVLDLGRRLLVGRGHARRSRIHTQSLADIRRRRAADQSGRQLPVRGLARREPEFVVVSGIVLPALVIVCARRAVGLHDAFGEQVVDRLVLVDGLVGGEDVIERAILADDDDDVLDRRFRGRSGFGGLRIARLPAEQR